MYTITARNVNDAYRKGLRCLLTHGQREASRNGPVLRVPDLVSTVYTHPTERVLFDAQRDANPFFHLFEALWMLDGGNDVHALSPLLPTFKQYSDDGETFHGAYGHRWRRWPVHRTDGYVGEHDQLAHVIRMLQSDPTTRRAVIAMWDPTRDLGAQSKDIPCNDLVNIGIRAGRLDLSVTCRSNDIIWGCYGANAVHMSVLHEYLAAMIGVPVGVYTQISFDYHAYLESPYTLDRFWPLTCPDEIGYQDEDTLWVNNYAPDDGDELTVQPLVTDPRSFDAENRDLITAIRRDRTVSGLDWTTFENRFLGCVAIPMYLAWELHKGHRDVDALRLLNAAQIVVRTHGTTVRNDWLAAGMAWIERRRGIRATRAISATRDYEQPAEERIT